MLRMLGASDEAQAWGRCIDVSYRDRCWVLGPFAVAFGCLFLSLLSTLWWVTQL